MTQRLRALAGAVALVLIGGATLVIAGIVSSPAASAATSTFTPAADTYVQNDQAGTNFGTSGQLDVDLTA